MYPLQSRQHLTVTAVCLCSLTMWISSEIAWVAKNLMAIISTITVGTIIFDTFILLIVCSIIILLHVKKKIRTLQHSPAVTDQTSRMNIVVTLIISIFVLFRLSNIVTDILILMFVFRVTSFPSYETGLYNFYFYTFIGCINFSCNPCIYFFHNISRTFDLILYILDLIFKRSWLIQYCSLCF